MIKKIIYPVAFLLGSLLLCGCEQAANAPDFSQPIVDISAVKGTITIGSETITTGPLKDYESDSEVVYKLTATSDKPLSKFTVTSSSDAISQLSRIIKTVPEGAIDEKGNFTNGINEVVIFYAYHIHPLVTAASQVKITFNLFNNSNNASSVYHTFSVIKKGSTDGKLLNMIKMPFNSANYSESIGTQDALLDESEGTRPEGVLARRGPLFSLSAGFSLDSQSDAIANADGIDLVGYQTRYAGTDPVLVTNSFYLVSPSDTTVLTSSFAGAVVASLQLNGTSGTANISFAGLTNLSTFRTNVTTTASDFVTSYKAAYAAAGLTIAAATGKLTWTATKRNPGIEPVQITTLTGTLNGVNEISKVLRKNMIMRTTIRQMSQKLKANGKDLRVVYFKRLDNIVGPNQVTTSGFDMLTHDNEFDVLLAGIKEAGVTMTGPMGLDQVYGFVTADGKRGLIRSSPATVFMDNVNVSVPVPNAGNWVLYCTIKYQNAK